MKSKTISRFSLRTSSGIIEGVFAGLLPFFLANAAFFGGLSPFSAAFAGAVPVRRIIPAILGAVCGLFVFSPAHLPLRLTTLAMLTALRLGAARLVPSRSGVLLHSLLVLGAGSISLTFYALLARLTTASLILLALELVLSTGFCVLFAQGFSASERVFTGQALGELSRIGLCAVYAAVLAALTAMPVFSINPAIIVSTVCILLAAQPFGAAGTSVAGILCAASLCLASGELFTFAVTLAVGAFFCGAFRGGGRFAPMVVLLTCSIFILFLLGIPVAFAYHTVSLFIGCAVWILLPETVTRRFCTAFSGTSAAPLRRVLADRLHLLADAAFSVKKELVQVTDRFNRIDYHNISSVYESAASGVCKTCEHNLSCWDTRYHETMDALQPLERILRQNGTATAETLPRHFREICRKPEALCQAINARYRVFLSQEQQARQIRREQQLVVENLESLGETLSSLKETLLAAQSPDSTLQKAAQTALDITGASVSSIEAVRLNDGSAQITATLHETEVDPDLLLDVLQEKTGILFAQPAIIRFHDRCRLLFCENASYFAESAVRQLPSGEHHVCGDSCEIFTDAKGQACFLLSDGMGSGGRAAIDSLMTCSMLKKLLGAGFEPQTALRLANAALSIKSADESTATVDLFTLHPSTGEAVFFKAGAAVSLLLHEKELRIIGRASLPIGIVQPPQTTRDTLMLCDGDLVILLSDGALSAGTEAIKRAACSNLHRGINEIATAICGAVMQKGGVRDDLTVLVVRITKSAA